MRDSSVTGWAGGFPRVLISTGVRKKGQSERFGDARLLALKIEKEATSQGVQMPLKAGKDKEINSPREYLERFWPCQHFDFRPVRPIWISDLQNHKIKKKNYIVLSHQVCAHLLQVQH